MHFKLFNNLLNYHYFIEIYTNYLPRFKNNACQISKICDTQDDTDVMSEEFVLILFEVL